MNWVNMVLVTVKALPSTRKDTAKTISWVACVAVMHVAWPSDTVAVPWLISGGLFVLLGVRRWRQTGLSPRLVVIAFATFAGSLMSAAFSALNMEIAAATANLVCGVLVLVFICSANRFRLSNRRFLWNAASIVAFSALMVWIIEGERALRSGAELPLVTLEVAYLTMSFTSFAVSAMPARSRSRDTTIMALMTFCLLVGDVLYAGTFASVWTVAERWMLLPHTVAYAAAAALFMPAMTRKLMLVKNDPADGWRVRGVVAGVMLSAAVVAMTAGVVESTVEIAVRAVLGSVLMFTVAFRVTELARAESSNERQMSSHATVDAQTGMPTALFAIERWEQNHPASGTVAITIVWEDLDDVEMLFGADVRDRLVAVTARRALQSASASYEAEVGVRSDGKVVLLVESAGNGGWSVADRVHHATSTVVALHEGTFVPKVSVGFSAGIGSTRVLVREATRATYQATRVGGRCVVSAATIGETEMRKDLATVDAAAQAVERGDCKAVTSVVVGSESGTILGLRSHPLWWAAGRQFTSSEMERLSSTNDQALRCFTQAFAEAASGYQARRSAGEVPLNALLFLDVSSSQMVNPASQKVVEEGCRRWGIRPDRLVLFLKEREMVVNSEELAEAIERFNELGVQIGVSHFGESNMGLSRMRGYPIAFLSIADDIASRLDSTHNARLVRAAAAAGEVLGFAVIARSDCGSDGRELLRSSGASFAEVTEVPSLG